jgi:hypothetical protein
VQRLLLAGRVYSQHDRNSALVAVGPILPALSVHDIMPIIVAAQPRKGSVRIVAANRSILLIDLRLRSSTAGLGSFLSTEILAGLCR